MSADLLLTLTPTEQQDLETIEESGLFDADFYLSVHQDVAGSKIDPLIHYVKYGFREGRQPNRNFRPASYLRQYPDADAGNRNPFIHFLKTHGGCHIAHHGLLPRFHLEDLSIGARTLEQLPFFTPDLYHDINRDIERTTTDMAEHALLYGVPEGRRIFGALHVSRTLGALCAAKGLDDADYMVADGAVPDGIGVYYNSNGNVFIHEIASDLCTTLRESGLNCVLLDETGNPDDRPELCIFVAPHEFFHLGQGQDWATGAIIRDAIMFNTEQPQTLWFERGIPFLLMAAGVIDICHQMAESFRQAGLPAIHFTPNVGTERNYLQKGDMQHAMVRILPPACRRHPDRHTPFADRQLDISFFGGLSAHREKFFACNAGFFAQFRNYFYYRKFTTPIDSSPRDNPLSRLASHVAGHSRIALNIHRDDYGFFEWHRIVKGAMANGSVVVSEPCLPHPVFRPNVHFLEESGRHIPNLIEWLLNTPDGQAKAEDVRLAAMRAIDTPAHNRARCARIRGFISHVWSTPEA
ncbi:hypothetical protein KOEU_20050 [Komagataeibacter europaeus]|uniref:Uncharacterized protein n=1 Tax=Komagataeibacter europaeus TaxID=33995 RepID=A0A0M0EHL3_KOMEU|nr:hypothetical protein [Komagataeibacter europaeus]ARW17778.1 Glucuronosyl-N-acetylgalactosaminyl-proteoglycan 4-beta-N-acetylgalactosaminyltransferase [Komagataeibacter europaeus]KON64421.1 hypothetical protein KOEU_20050 [Komagataeibacter europaeus]